MEQKHRTIAVEKGQDNMSLCECGCGKEVKNNGRFTRGHNLRVSHPFLGIKRPKHSERIKGINHPLYGKFHSQGSKEKMSKSCRKYWKEHPDKLKKSNNAKEKMSLARRLYWERYPERRVEVGEYLKPRCRITKHTEEAKEKIRQSKLGICLSQEVRKKISETRIKNKIACKEKNPRWLGGISFEPYGIEFNKLLKIKVKERDGYMCLLCGNDNLGRRLVVHHIDYNKKNNGLDNLIALCNRCHSLTNSNRNYYVAYFQGVTI